MSNRICGLTTFDNPFNPLLDFRNWLNFDIEKGYGTCEYLARIAKVSDVMSDKAYNEEIERAIDEIIEINCVDGKKSFYKKVTISGNL